MKRLLWLLPLIAIVVAVLMAWMGLRGDPHTVSNAPRIAPQLTEPIARGAYLAVVGNCRGCHTERGGTPYAGGRAIPTPFGTFHGPNLTPDVETGIGDWSGDDFWRALHEGRGHKGELLYPVFPFTHYTKVTRADSDALFAYLRSLPAVARANTPHQLRFPFSQRWLLVVWRALYFRPGVYTAAPTQSAAWNHGAYLAQGLGHCGACHQPRNALGAPQTSATSAGGVVLDWYAPALDASHEAGVAHWPQAEVVALLQTGVTPDAATLGPMGEVVFESLQHWQPEDMQAMAEYLRALPDRDTARARQAVTPTPRQRSQSLERGASDYAKHCASCHGDNGEGRTPAALALAGNRAVTMGNTINPIRTVLYGGYGPGTAGNPQPFGMPPFHNTLSDREIADILSFVRSTWGNAAEPVNDFEVARQRTGPLW